MIKCSAEDKEGVGMASHPRVGGEASSSTVKESLRAVVTSEPRLRGREKTLHESRAASGFDRSESKSFAEQELCVLEFIASREGCLLRRIIHGDIF